MTVLEKVLPIVSNITVSDWKWVSIEDIMQMGSSDCESKWKENDHNCVLEYCIVNLSDKRYDRGYKDLLISLKQDGYLDPICIYGGSIMNGHHRLFAAMDLGYTHVPVTSNSKYQWRDSGVSAQ